MHNKFQTKRDTRRTTIKGVYVLALIYFSIGLASADQRLKLVVNGHEISASVASTFAQRKKGLMNRKNLAENEGMLFVFPKADHHSMWMKNTLIPLSVAFLDHDGNIINIEEMAALSLDQHAAQKPARYALEMNAEWFGHHQTKAGDRVLGLVDADKAR